MCMNSIHPYIVSVADVILECCFRPSHSCPYRLTTNNNLVIKAIFRMFFYKPKETSPQKHIQFLPSKCQQPCSFKCLRLLLQCCWNDNEFNINAKMPLQLLHIKRLAPSKQDTGGLLLGGSFRKKKKKNQPYIGTVI